MATITSYNTLLSNVQAVVEDDGLEFADYIPTAIDLAEERLFKELDLPELEKKVTGILSINSPFISKPSDMEFKHFLSITVNNVKKFLKKRPEDYITDYWPNSTLTGEPKYYADISRTQILVAPTPDSGYAYEAKYTGKPTKLSVTNQTNYYTDYCTDILYAAVMAEMAKFMKAWSQIGAWENTYVVARDTWNIEMSRKRRDDLEVPRNPSGGPNSLKHTIDSTS